jgi:hypothetical protein
VRHLLADLLQRGLADQLGDLPLDVVVGGLRWRVHRRPLRQQPDQQVGQQLDLVEARVGLEMLLGGRVHLALHVTVLGEWQDDPKKLQRLGY